MICNTRVLEIFYLLVISDDVVVHARFRMNLHSNNIVIFVNNNNNNNNEEGGIRIIVDVHYTLFIPFRDNSFVFFPRVPI